MKRRKYSLVVKARTGLSGGLSGRKVIPGLTTDFLCDWAWTEGTDSISMSCTHREPCPGTMARVFQGQALLSERLMSCSQNTSPAMWGHGRAWSGAGAGEEEPWKLLSCWGEMNSIQAMASLLPVSCSPAEWETTVQLPQLQQSRVVNYDFLSPNLCCSGVAQQWATSSYMLAVPPCAAMVETIGPGRPHKNTFLREKKEKRIERWRVICGLIKESFTSALTTLLVSFSFMGRQAKRVREGDGFRGTICPINTFCTLKVTSMVCLCPAPGSHSPGCTTNLSCGLSDCLKWNLAGLNQKSSCIRFALACMEVVASHNDMVAIKLVATGSYPRVQLCFVPCRLVGLC